MQKSSFLRVDNSNKVQEYIDIIITEDMVSFKEYV